MLHLRSLPESLPLFRALGSDVRIAILETLLKEGPLHMSAISDAVGISDGALTPHIKTLQKSGLISIEVASGRHGVQKLCSVNEDRILIDMRHQDGDHSVYETEIGVGQYTAYDIYPTCGLATREHLVGEVDDPRHFASPERLDSEILWFGRGYVEYMIPNFLSAMQELQEIQLSMELCSEAPGSAEIGQATSISISMAPPWGFGRACGFWYTAGYLQPEMVVLQLEPARGIQAAVGEPGGHVHRRREAVRRLYRRSWDQARLQYHLPAVRA